MKHILDCSNVCIYEQWKYVGPQSVQPWDLDFKVFNEEYLGCAQDSSVRFTYCDFYQDGMFTNAVDTSKPYYCTGVNFGMPCKVIGPLFYAIGNPDDSNGQSSLLLVKKNSPCLSSLCVPRDIYIGGCTSADDTLEYHFI